MADAQLGTSHLDHRTLASVDSLELRARLIVEGVMIGMHRSPYQGISIEFAQHRQYASGDDLRHLDWKVFARSDKLYLKQYQKETNLDLVILVDGSGSMAYSSHSGPQWRKYDLAASIAAALAYLALRQQDRVSIVVFAAGVVTQTRQSNARDQWRTVLNTLQSQSKQIGSRPESTNGQSATDLARVFDQVVARLSQRSVLVLLSDLFDEPAALERGMAMLFHRRHDLMIFQTLDHAELAFPFQGPSLFFGLESEGRLPVDPAALRQAYLSAFGAHSRRIEELARRFQYDHLQLDSSQPLGPALSRFLAGRAASVRRRS